MVSYSRSTFYSAEASVPLSNSRLPDLEGKLRFERYSTNTVGDLTMLGLVSELTPDEHALVVQAFQLEAADLEQREYDEALEDRGLPPADDAKLMALWRYARSLTRCGGWAEDAEREAFQAAGYSARSLLELAVLYGSIVLQRYRKADPNE